MQSHISVKIPNCFLKAFSFEKYCVYSIRCIQYIQYFLFSGLFQEHKAQHIDSQNFKIRDSNVGPKNSNGHKYDTHHSHRFM